MRKGFHRVSQVFGSIPREFSIALVVTLLATILVPSLLAAVDHHSVELWAAALMLCGGGFAGLVIGASFDRESEHDGDALDALREQLREREYRYERYEGYAEHLRQILDHLEQVIARDLPDVGYQDFIERGILMPARDMLKEASSSEDVRLSVLAPRDDSFEMPFAAGHTFTGKERFSLRIADSVSRFALERGEPFLCSDLDAEVAFRPHPEASRPYRSMISLPIVAGGRTWGVFNTIATDPNAFEDVDIEYVKMLGSIVNIATSLILAAGGNSGQDAETAG